ncbi:MAG: dockerin type I domain-containing protein [Pirellulales bacterium]
MAVYTVTSTADSGTGTLRDALVAANANAGQDRIVFNLPAGDRVIRPTGQLPWLTDSVILDATTQPGYVDHPLVEIDGSLVTQQFAGGLTINSDDSQVRGLVINHFDYGITVLNSGRAVVAGNYLGTNAAGTAKVGNNLNGAYVLDSVYTTIGGTTAADRNVISGNGETGIRISGSKTNNTRVSGNYIGTSASGKAAIPNSQYGILLANDASENVIGVEDGASGVGGRNIISGNNGPGISVATSNRNRIAGNWIGVGADGFTSVGNASDGIGITNDSRSNVVGIVSGGTVDNNEANVIAFNRYAGIRINSAYFNAISGNMIGVLADGESAAGNGGDGILIDGNSTDNEVGYSDFSLRPTQGNIIADNGSNGVWLSETSSNRVNGNRIGTTASGATGHLNAGRSVLISNANKNQIGTEQSSFYNLIAYNQTAIVVNGSSVGNTLGPNDFVGAGTNIIDLGNNGATSNDSGDTDIGPNGLVNYPEVQSVHLGMSGGGISGMVNGKPYQGVGIQLYTQRQVGGLLRTEFYGSTSVLTYKSGSVGWSVNADLPAVPYDGIRALASVLSEGTSEFSPIVSVSDSRLMGFPGGQLVSESAGTIQAQVHRSTLEQIDDQQEVVISLRSSDPSRATVPAQVTIPAGQRFATFPVTLIDDSYYNYEALVLFAAAAGGDGSVRLFISDNESEWHNYIKPLDVNRDNVISGIDALLIINMLNTNQGGNLANRVGNFQPIYYDVTNDNFVTALDALYVINSLNNPNGAAEGASNIDSLGASIIGVGQNDPLQSAFLQAAWNVDEQLSINKRRSRA